jgi:DNA-directed RNA polymerase subunit RPC12/RpoP
VRWLWLGVTVAALVLAVVVDLRVVVALVAAYLIFRSGMALLSSLRADAGTVTTPAPEPVADTEERTVYRCEECGTELLLLVRGEESPPRHCGERMRGRTEVPRSN